MKNVYKLITLGDQGVGKTSIVENYVNSKFSQHVEPTLGACFYKKDIAHQGKSYSFEVACILYRSGTLRGRSDTNPCSNSTIRTQM